MRINTSSAPVTGGARAEPGADSAPAPLEKGASLEVKILSNDNGVATLKTESGQIFKARLDGGAQLSPGDTATLKITEVTAEAIYLSVQSEEDLSIPQRSALAGQTLDGSLAAFAAKLGSLRLPVSRETAEAMRDMLAANPEMSLDEAAFLASNKIPAGSKLAEAARALITDGARLDDMVRSMASLLDGAEDSSAARNAAEVQGKAAAQTLEASVPKGGAPALAGGKGGDAPLTAWLAGVLDSDSGRISQDTPAGAAAAPAEAASGQSAAASAKAPAADSPALQSARQALVEILSGIPEFKDTPAKALSEFSERLLGEASRAGAPSQSPDTAEKLRSLLDGLFEKLPQKDERGGEIIRRAKEALFMRLTLFEEALEGSGGASKAALIKETENLINHVKLQNSIDQFVYMQLPIKLGEENKTAELYVYKQRKGARSIDPENVSILLTLDLEHIGHTESFVKIRGREVSLQTEVPADDSKALFTENTVMLHEMLTDIGFRLAGMNVSCGKDATTPLTAMISLLERGRGPASGVDYTV